MLNRMLTSKLSNTKSRSIPSSSTASSVDLYKNKFIGKESGSLTTLESDTFVCFGCLGVTCVGGIEFGGYFCEMLCTQIEPRYKC